MGDEDGEPEHAPDGDTRGFSVRRTRPADIPQIIGLSRETYAPEAAWTESELRSHLAVFPEGQRVAADLATREVLGMTASLIVAWDDYDPHDSWAEFTAGGRFTNHDPAGSTLYGAGVLVRASARGRGIGGALYGERRRLVRDLGLRRIRAGARLSGYHAWADRMTARAYTDRVIAGELRDPTLTFQLRQGFRVIGVARDYLPEDPDSRGWAAVIEWVPDAEDAG